ncbi:MAG: cryptochrome/photolyase family protein, partial [Marinirhabdus sp.]
KLAQNSGVGFYTFKDHVIFEKDEITKPNGGPYVVYTPYMKRWRATFNAEKHLKTYPAHQHLGNLYKNTVLPNLSLAQIGFERSHIRVPGHDVTQTLLQQYEGTRNFPAKDGTSQVGPHLRFGTVSIREIVKKAIAQKNPVFLQELIWREFFIQVLYHFPKTVTNAFKPKYDRIPWRTDKTDIKAWQQGKTGYPLVDAGIRQLNKTGYMHNRVRMVVASFFCKHLLLNWRLGEAYFAQKLLDYEQASNVGNWQWAAGSGVDAAPYFRVFNPTAQAEKFDKGHKYIKTWVKEFGTAAYPEPIVDHKKARERAISTYKKALYQ